MLAFSAGTWRPLGSEIAHLPSVQEHVVKATFPRQRIDGVGRPSLNGHQGLAGVALLGLATAWKVLPKQRRLQRHGLAQATERNRGIDPKRLLSTMHKVGIGSPDPQLPAPSDSIRANSKDAAVMLLEKRQKSIEKGEAGLRPTMKRRDYRLPLIVKYYKPEGLVTRMRNLNTKKQMEDLRSVVSFAGDEFELDLYHPVGQLSADASGLFLWSRSGLITRQLQDVRRGVVTVMELEVWGTVDKPALQEAFARGISLGVTGFEKTYTARVQEAYLVPESPLQDLRSRVIVCCVDGRAKIPAMLGRCGYKVAAVKRLQVGGFALGDMEEGQLKAASPQEEAWACQLAGLPASEYPEGILPESYQIEEKPRRGKSKRRRR